MTAALFSTSSRKKQRITLESVTSLPASNETAECDCSARCGRACSAGVTGFNTGLEGTVVAGPSSGGEKRALLAMVAWR